MKKKLVIGILCIAVIAIIVAAIVLSQMPKTTDYTKLAEKEIFYTNLSFEEMKLIDADEFENQSLNNRAYIKCIDENGNPIPEAEVELYDDDGYALLKRQANSDGVVAIANLEYNQTYYCKQTKTRDGLVMDDTLYSMEVSGDATNTYTVILVSSQNEMEEEARKEIAKKYADEYSEKLKSDVKVAISTNEINEKYSGNIQDQFLFCKEPLTNLKMEFVNTDEKLKISDEQTLSGKIIRIPGAQVLEYTITTNDTNVTFLNGKKEATNTFKDGEPYYIQTPTDYSGGVKYRYEITFQYDGQIYKVAKELDKMIMGSKRGSLEVTFYEGDTKELQTSKRNFLYLLNNVTKEKVPVFLGWSSSKGKMKFENMPFGTYVVSKIKDKEEIFTEEIEIKNEETVKVDF